MADPVTNQPDWRPTRKLFWGTVVAMLSVALQNLVATYLPGADWLGDPALQGWPNIIVGGAIGYFVKDRANVPVDGAQSGV